MMDQRPALADSLTARLKAAGIEVGKLNASPPPGPPAAGARASEVSEAQPEALRATATHVDGREPSTDAERAAAFVKKVRAGQIEREPAEAFELLGLPDSALCVAWRELSIEERGGLPAHVRAGALARFNEHDELAREIPKSVERLKRAQERGARESSAAVIRFDRGEPGVPPSQFSPEAGERRPANGQDAPPLPVWPPSLDLEALAEREPLSPKFIIADWLPVGYAAGVFGHGGAGKSHAIALTLAVCAAAGVPFYGLPVVRCRVMLLSCEDREGVLHWRLARTCAALGVDLASLRGWLEVIDLVGHDSVLWAPDRDGRVLTAAYGALQERMAAHQTELLIVDGISDTFGGNENARTDVKRYVNALLALIPPDSGAVLLVGHVNKATAGNGATGEGYSGSTAWHNSTRARWYLYPEVEQADDAGRAQPTGELVLELQKSNLGRTAQSIRLRWDEDARVFTGQAPDAMSHFDRAQQSREEVGAVLRALKGCAEASPPVVVPAALSGPRTAFHVLSRRPEFPESLRSGRSGMRRFWRLIEDLRQSHAIEDVIYRRTNRHASAQIVLTTEGVRQCAE